MNRIKQARIAAGMSQKYVAMELGVAGPSVSNWESGKTKPTQENIKALANLFGVSVDYLLGRDDAPSPHDPPIDPHTYYAQKFGDETQAIVDHFLDLMASMPDEKSRLKTAEGAVTLAHGILAECDQEGKA